MYYPTKTFQISCYHWRCRSVPLNILVIIILVFCSLVSLVDLKVTGEDGDQNKNSAISELSTVTVLLPEYQSAGKVYNNSGAKNNKQQVISTCPTETTIVIRNYTSRSFSKNNHNQSLQSGSSATLLAEDNSGNVLEIPHNGFVKLTCFGSEPVKWTFRGYPHQSVRQLIKFTEIKRDSIDPRNVSINCFRATIILELPPNVSFAGSGLYICSTVNSLKNQKSLYLYGNEQSLISVSNFTFKVDDNLPKGLSKPNGTSDSIIVKSFDGESTVVPCLTNLPNITVELTKQNLQGDFVPLGQARFNVDHSSKLGFIISEKRLGDSNTDFHGLYKCRALNGQLKNDTLQIRLENAGEKPKLSNKLKIIVQDYGSYKRFACMSKFLLNSNTSGEVCHSSTSSLELNVIKCSNPIDCEMALSFVETGLDSPDAIQSEANSCHSGSSPVSNEVPATDYYTEKAYTKIRPSYKAGVVICRTRDRKHFQYSNFIRSISSSASAVDKIILIPASPFSSKAEIGSRSGSDLESIFIEDTSPKLQFRSRPLDPLSVINILEHSPRMYVKEHHQISCDTSSFLFAKGSKWLVQYSNGSLSPPQIIENKLYFQQEDYKREMDTVINITTTEMVAIICFAPLWNSNEWLNVTYPIKVYKGISPKIIQRSEHRVMFHHTDVNQTLFCEASGSPPPQITWFKFGKVFEDNTQNAEIMNNYTEDSTRSTLHFSYVNFDGISIAGVYSCNASNTKGAVLHSITVRVQNNSPYTYWIIVGCLLLSVIVLAALLFKYRKQFQLQEVALRQLWKYEMLVEFMIFKYGRRNIHLPTAMKKSIGARNPNDHSIISVETVCEGIQIALDSPYNEALHEVPESNLILENNPQKLGEGNFGIVVKGILLQKNAYVTVAVKMLKEWDVKEAKVLLAELKILTFVGEHENVVSLLGAITDSSKCKIHVIIEYCANGSLESFLRQRRHTFLDENVSADIKKHNFEVDLSMAGSCTYVQASQMFTYDVTTSNLNRWAYEFARGMEYLASLQIVHGDLACRNLLLTDTRTLKITDFGLSRRLVSDPHAYISRSNRAEVDMPWRTVALEYLDNIQPLSTESDVWAFGITLWEIFSLAQVPYPDFPVYTPDFVRYLRGGQRMAKAPYASNQMDNTMRSCWTANPKTRPTFSELVSKLEKIQHET